MRPYGARSPCGQVGDDGEPPWASIRVIPFRWDRIRSREILTTTLRMTRLNTVPKRSNSLPRDLSTTLEMTRLRSVSQGWRRDEGVPPYRSGFTPVKVSLYSNSIPLGGRGTPLPRLDATNREARYILKPSPLGEGGTSVSEAIRVTDEGSGYDERNVKDNPLISL